MSQSAAQGLWIICQDVFEAQFQIIVFVIESLLNNLYQKDRKTRKENKTLKIKHSKINKLG